MQYEAVQYQRQCHVLRVSEGMCCLLMGMTREGNRETGISPLPMSSFY